LGGNPMPAVCTRQSTAGLCRLAFDIVQATRQATARRLLERNTEEVDSVPFSRNVRIERNVLFRCAVFRRRERIEHLEWIAAADRARNYAVNFLLGNGRGAVSLAPMMPGLERSGMRGSSSGSRWLT
jgi:hypothetical protein